MNRLSSTFLSQIQLNYYRIDSLFSSYVYLPHSMSHFTNCMNSLQLQMSESDSFEEQADGQNSVVCGVEDCQENDRFYCHACHRLLCEQCKDEHKKVPILRTM